MWILVMINNMIVSMLETKTTDYHVNDFIHKRWA